MTTSTNNPPTAVPRLGPAWRGKGSGFQPPPAVPDAERRPPPGTSGTNNTNSTNNNGTRDRSNSNPFSALDDEEEGRFSHLRSTSSTSGTGATFTRSSSTGVATVPSKPRSLADLAASVPRRGSASAAAISSGGGGGGENEKVLRYTREKLLSLRPRRGEGEGGELPEVLRHLEGSVVVSRVAQDPVCWDDFHPEEIWAAPPPARERRTTDRPLLKPLDRSSSGGRLRDVLDSGGDDSHPSTTSGSGSGTATRSRSNLGSSSTGRWQRGVALPPGNNEENRRSNSGGGRGESGYYPEADDPNDLWDDPGGGGTGAAPDFSQFGASLEEDIPPPSKGKSGLGSGAFELSDMSRAAAAFEMELHGQENGRGNEENGEGVEGGEDSYSHRVDESRPLASSGTTIRSGSGDHVNVFEDFGDEEEEAAEEGQGTSAAESSKKGEDEEEVAIKSGNEMSASSRLMKMIGVGGSGDADGKGAATAVESKTEDPPATKVEAVQVASVPSNPWGAPVSIPSNPWGEPVVPDQSGGLVSLLSTQRAREAEIAAQRQREEEQRRRLLQEEEEKKRWAELQAKQQAEAQAQQQQQQQLRQQQQNQVELVLIERISNILENSWGRSDLVSILSTLHADDSRVIAILSNPDALRALINRHPQRIALVRDPAMGAEMAALIQTNQQWQIQQARLAQQQQAQAQAREQQELQRRRALEAQQQRQRLEAIAREREAQERQLQLQQQQQQHTHTVVADAPWFYADPQGNIQGPFGGDEMRQWLEAGYFKGNLPISQNNSGPFRPLSTYFPDPTTAFQPRVDESRAQAEARQKQAELAAAAAELKRREEEAARAQAEAQQRELEARARLKAEAESRMRAEEEAARIKAEEEAKHASEASNQNDQSVQLKMLLGLGGTSDAVVSEPEPAPQPAAKKQSKSKTQQKQASAGQESPPVPVTEVAPAPAAPAWGGAVAGPTAGRKKTMSEIQQEEAKAAAKRAAEGGGGQRSGGGWANVAATGGSTAWGGAAAKTPAAGVIPPNTAVIAGVASVQKINASRSTATVNNTQSQPPKSASNKDAVDNFGANGKMTPAFEKWCISQMQKINNSDDLTLVSFCMTLTDPIEIRQYLTAYLGSTPEVNNFATEFIKKKDGDNGRQEEWESAGGPKKGRKKKGGK